MKQIVLYFLAIFGGALIGSTIAACIAPENKLLVGIIGGIPLMKAEKLLPLCGSASEKLVADLSKKVKKISKKAAKKL